MNNYQQIQETIDSVTPRFKTESVTLPYLLHRVLQQDVIADINMPPFDKSAMDGFACRKDDLGNDLEVLEIPVGVNEIKKGEFAYVRPL